MFPDLLGICTMACQRSGPCSAATDTSCQLSWQQSERAREYVVRVGLPQAHPVSIWPPDCGSICIQTQCFSQKSGRS